MPVRGNFCRLESDLNHLPPAHKELFLFQDEITKVEQPALEQLQKLGWSYVPGATLAPAAVKGDPALAERAYYRDVVLLHGWKQPSGG